MIGIVNKMDRIVIVEDIENINRKVIDYVINIKINCIDDVYKLLDDLVEKENEFGVYDVDISFNIGDDNENCFIEDCFTEEDTQKYFMVNWSNIVDRKRYTCFSKYDFNIVDELTKMGKVYYFNNNKKYVMFDSFKVTEENRNQTINHRVSVLNGEDDRKSEGIYMENGDRVPF